MKTNILFKYFFGFLLSVMFALVVGMKATEEGGSGQTEEEKKAEKGMADAIAKILDKRLNGIMTEKMFTEKMEGFKIKAETIKEINDSLKAQSDIIKAFNAGSDDLPKTIMQATKAHIEGNEDLKKTLESGDSVKFKVKFTTKAAGTMTVAGSLDSSASVAPSGTTYTIDPNFIREYAQQPDIASIFQSSRIDTEVYTYTEQRAKDGSPDWKAEGATADTVDYEWVTSSSEVKEIKVKGKVSKKAMRYIPNFLMEVESLMTRDMKIKASSDFLYGDNVANTASVKGLTKHDIGFPGTTSFDGTISNPATADAITVSQAIIATRNADPVNVIILNPVDVAHLRIE
ncbi:hypothetical protein KAR91_19425, partial [Candidatus Pacearchaeota archaeon]|nr:hypothetical protein [Candidatus Pacearchaeota archaeon]